MAETAEMCFLTTTLELCSLQSGLGWVIATVWLLGSWMASLFRGLPMVFP